MSSPGIYNPVMYRGDGWARRFEFRDGVGALRPTPADECLAQWRESRDAPTSVAFVISDISEGIVVVSMTGAVTAGLLPTGVWDFEHTPAGGEPITLLTGEVTVNPDVTRSGV